LLNYNELPPLFAIRSVSWPVLDEFVLKYPTLQKEVREAIELNEVAVDLAVSDSSVSNSDVNVHAIKVFLKVFETLIQNLHTLGNYKDSILEGKDLSEYKDRFFEIINKVATDSAFCKNIFTDVNLTATVMQSISKDWQDLIVKIHTSFTEYNYFTEKSKSFFNEERSARHINRLDMSGRVEKGLFKENKSDYKVQRTSETQR